MKKPSRTEYVSRQLFATLLSLSMVILLASVAQAALDCTRCHGVNASDAHPVDTPAGSLPTYRNITTGAVRGNHNTHSAAATTGNVCTKCHGAAAATYTSKHAILNHYSIQISPTVKYNRYTSALSYIGHENDNIAASAQTSNPKLGKCSNVNCHFESRTPVWGSNPLGAPDSNTCTTCHNDQPTTGSHSIHIAEHGANLNACAYCHADHTVEAKPFQHATSAGNNSPIQINTGHSYTGDGLNYLPSQSANRNFGKCSTAYCHDDGLGNGALSLVESPVWGSAVLQCNVCHLRRPTTGSHIAHVATSNIGCANCHKGAVEGSTPPVKHNDGVVDVFTTTPGDLGYPVNKAKGSAYTTCSTASCHINPSNNGAQMVTPIWGDASQQKCSYCHAAVPTTGGHQNHYDAGLTACGYCHAGAVVNTTVSNGHSNGVIDVYQVTPGDLGYPQAKAIGSAVSTCSNLYCHQDGRGNKVTSPVWGTTVAKCTACHGVIPQTGSHVQHVTNQNYDCGTCHKGASLGASFPAGHVNGVVDVYVNTPGDLGYPAAKAIGSSYASCNASACHRRASPVWGSNTTNYVCTKCHGVGVAFANYSSKTNAQSAPGYRGAGLNIERQTGTVVSNVSSDPKVGAHDTHLRSLNNLGKPVSCSDCHLVPTTLNSLGHMNGSSTPTWSNLVQNKETYSGSAIPYTYAGAALITSYDPATGTCSNMYCHGSTLTDGNNTSPKWNDGTYLTGDRSHDCAQCHGFPPTTSTRKAHNPAIESNCSDCHPHNGTRDATDPLAGYDFHINGNLEASKFCNACHDYDTRGTGGTIWGKNQMAVEGFGAHAVHINYLKKRMNITTMDSNVDIYGSANFDGVCGMCHNRDPNSHEQSANRATSLRKIIFGDPANRLVLQFGQSLPLYNGITGVSSAVTPKNCSNTSCHYKTSPVWQPF